MLIQWGSIVTAGSGKLGGHVYARNRGGSYVRTKTTPVNPQTPEQMESRASLAQFSQGWSALTQEERDGWVANAQLFPVTDPFGNPRFLSGKNLYTSLNKELELTSQTLLTEAPVPADLGVPTSLSATAAAGVPAASLTVTGTEVGDVLVITSSGPVTPGTSFVKNKMRVIGIAPSTADTTVVDALADYNARFGTLVAGQKIYFGAYAVNTVGQRSPEVRGFAVVAA